MCCAQRKAQGGKKSDSHPIPQNGSRKKKIMQSERKSAESLREKSDSRSEKSDGTKSQTVGGKSQTAEVKVRQPR